MDFPIEVDLAAPVLAHHEIDIAAPLEAVWALHTDVDRRVVPLERMADGLVAAVLATEDKGFYDHGAIDPEAPLFNDGLGLDSIDALELALEIGKRYGVQLRADDAENHRMFASLRALSTFIESRRER
mgnify:CR=1 FL=1